MALLSEWNSMTIYTHVHMWTQMYSVYDLDTRTEPEKHSPWGHWLPAIITSLPFNFPLRRGVSGTSGEPWSYYSPPPQPAACSDCKHVPQPLPVYSANTQGLESDSVFNRLTLLIKFLSLSLSYRSPAFTIHADFAHYSLGQVRPNSVSTRSFYFIFYRTHWLLNHFKCSLCLYILSLHSPTSVCLCLSVCLIFRQEAIISLCTGMSCTFILCWPSIL